MSYITPARRTSRLPVRLLARMVSATAALQRAGFDVAPACRDAADPSTTYQVALDADSETCILIGTKPGHQEISLCLLDEGDFCLMPGLC